MEQWNPGLVAETQESPLALGTPGLLPDPTPWSSDFAFETPVPCLPPPPLSRPRSWKLPWPAVSHCPFFSSRAGCASQLIAAPESLRQCRLARRRPHTRTGEQGDPNSRPSATAPPVTAPLPPCAAVLGAAADSSGSSPKDAQPSTSLSVLGP